MVFISYLKNYFVIVSNIFVNKWYYKLFYLMKFINKIRKSKLRLKCLFCIYQILNITYPIESHISLLKTMNSGLNNGEQRESIKLRSVDN